VLFGEKLEISDNLEATVIVAKILKLRVPVVLGLGSLVISSESLTSPPPLPTRSLSTFLVFSPPGPLPLRRPPKLLELPPPPPHTHTPTQAH
jgi:hypothetical protein